MVYLRFSPFYVLMTAYKSVGGRAFERNATRCTAQHHLSIKLYFKSLHVRALIHRRPLWNVDMASILRHRFPSHHHHTIIFLTI